MRGGRASACSWIGPWVPRLLEGRTLAQRAAERQCRRRGRASGTKAGSADDLADHGSHRADFAVLEPLDRGQRRDELLQVLPRSPRRDRRSAAPGRARRRRVAPSPSPPPASRGSGRRARCAASSRRRDPSGGRRACRPTRDRARSARGAASRRSPRRRRDSHIARAAACGARGRPSCSRRLFGDAAAAARAAIGVARRHAAHQARRLFVPCAVIAGPTLRLRCDRAPTRRRAGARRALRRATTAPTRRATRTGSRRRSRRPRGEVRSRWQRTTRPGSVKPSSPQSSLGTCTLIFDRLGNRLLGEQPAAAFGEIDEQRVAAAHPDLQRDACSRAECAASSGAPAPW